MDKDTQKRIAALPEDAPAAAVIAAWAGEDPVVPHRHVSSVNVYAIWDERTLRRWLLDGGVRICEHKSVTGKYLIRLSWDNSSDDTEQLHSRSDTPEAAFTAAVEQFASALREDAKV